MPILHSRGFADALVAASRAKTLGRRLARVLRDPAARSASRSRRRSPSRRPARRWGSRRRRWRSSITSRASEQDQFALRSHRLAAAGTADGRLTAEIAPLYVPPRIRDRRSRRDNGIRERHELRPARRAQAGVRPHVRHGHGGEFLAAHRRRRRGAAHERGARRGRWGTSRSAFIRSYAYAALDPGEQLLQAPVLAAPVGAQARRAHAEGHRPRRDARGVRRAGALQPAGFESQTWADRGGFATPVGTVDRTRLNVMGGSIAIGHPFGATGARILTTLVTRARAARRTVRPHDGVCGRRDGPRHGGRARMSTSICARRALARHRTVAVVTLDVPGEPVNTFTARGRARVRRAARPVERDQSVRAAVLLSGKPDVWIAGADIEELLELPGAAEAERLSRTGHELMDRVERLRTPVVAAIHGACLGGGLELALACAYRIATENPKTVLALPEVQLGLIPGAGGTQRLPRIVGLRAALDMILTGKNVRARKALQTGLVDEVVHPAILRDIAMQSRARIGGGGRTRPAAPAASGRAARAGGSAAAPARRQPARARGGVPAGALSRRSRGRMATTRRRWPRSTPCRPGICRDRGADFETEARLFGEVAATRCRQAADLSVLRDERAQERSGRASRPRRPRCRSTRSASSARGSWEPASRPSPRSGASRCASRTPTTSACCKGLAAVRDVLHERLAKQQITRQEFDDQMSLVVRHDRLHRIRRACRS